MSFPTVDFLGIGAQRAGTTWLYRCLRQHPQLYLPGTKELHYFSRLAGLGPRFTKVRSVWSGLFGLGAAEREWRQRVGWTFQKSVRGRISMATGRELVRAVSYHLPGPKNDAWYRRQFAAGTGRLKGEITPAYALLDDAGVRHVTRLFPEVKVIFLLREPLSRMLSQWHISSRDSRRVMTFLGVDPDEPRVLGEARTRDHHPAGAKPVVPPEVVREMARTSRPGIAALAGRLGGHAIGWLDRCDAILAGGDADG